MAVADSINTMHPLENLCQQIGDALMLHQAKLALAESCTGGGVAAAVTAIAGSSSWFDRGFVTYSNAAKTDMLGVREETLARHGAVSEATARAMAQGAIAHSLADWSIAITGIAGPGGGSEVKPVGTVCFAWAQREGGCLAETRHFAGDRAAVRAQSVEHALNRLLEELNSQSVSC